MSDSIFLGLIVAGVWWLISAFAVGRAAGHRGRGVGAWFWASIFFGPILAALLLLAYPVTTMDDEALTGGGWNLKPPEAE
jgi:uncharacterized membrane protein YhdT